jgi:hypothetical protein
MTTSRPVTLEEARGRLRAKVIYDPADGSEPELGVITSVGARFVFVRFSMDPEIGSKAVAPERLQWPA